jgi:RNA polymerase sigma factor (sigma-70 family)
MRDRACTHGQPHVMADSVLMSQARSGDQCAFETLIHRHQTPLFNYAYQFLGDYDQAWDVTQHVFLQLYLSMPIPRSAVPLTSWLMRVAYNRCVDTWRKERAVHFSQLESMWEEEDQSPLSLLVDPHTSPEEVAEQHEVRSILQRAIAALPPKLRSVVHLRYARQLSFSEIGRLLHMREATAKTYFHRALPLLRTALEVPFCVLVTTPYG